MPDGLPPRSAPVQPLGRGDADRTGEPARHSEADRDVRPRGNGHDAGANSRGVPPAPIERPKRPEGERNSEVDSGGGEGMEELGLDAPGLIAPHDTDAEGILLSHALEHGAIDGLLPKHFYSDANSRIYEAIRMLQVRGEPVDVVAVKR